MNQFEMDNQICREAPNDKGGGGASEGSNVDVKNNDPRTEFNNLAVELKNLVETQNEESAEYKTHIERINDRLDDLEFDSEKKSKAAVSEGKQYEHLDDFKKAFFAFTEGERKGLQSTEVKSGYHHVKSNLVRFDLASAGALLIPAEVSSDIIKNVIETTPALDLVRVRMSNAPSWKQRVRDGTPGGRWLGELASNSKTKPTYSIKEITPHKWAAQYGYSIEMQEDSAFDLVTELREAYTEDFNVDVGTAIVKGDGVGKPEGMVGNITNVNSGDLTLTADGLVEFQANLKDEYQNNGSWLFTRKTRAMVRKLFVTSGSAALQYLWEPDFTRRSPTRLLGSPTFIAREGDLAGVLTGDYTSGDVSLIYGDFDRGYTAVMRSDQYLIDDPYTEASEFVRNLHIMSRIGGGVVKSEALAQLTMTS